LALKTLLRAGRNRYFEWFLQKPISYFGRCVDGVGSPQDLRRNPTPDFFAEALGCGLADFFKFALPRVAAAVVEKMDSEKILSFILLLHPSAALDKALVTAKSRVFEGFYQKPISYFGRRVDGVGPPA